MDGEVYTFSPFWRHCLQIQAVAKGDDPCSWGEKGFPIPSDSLFGGRGGIIPLRFSTADILALKKP